MMTIILAGLSGVENSLDDIIIHGRDMASHDKTLQAVLQRLEVAGLQLNKDKCHFRQTSLLFLGHTVSAEVLRPDESRVQAILNAPAPSDASTLRSLLGLMSWYSKFLPDFATVVAPVHSCLQAPNGFSWSKEAEQSLTKVKR